MIKVCIDPSCSEVAHNTPKYEARCRNCGAIMMDVDEETYRHHYEKTKKQKDYATGEDYKPKSPNQLELF